jgi:hypothetical protein
LTREEQTRHVGKTPVFFGPPLAMLTAGPEEHAGDQRQAQPHGRALPRADAPPRPAAHEAPERQCLAHICHIGFMSPLEIRELPLEVDLTRFECEGLDKKALAAKLRAASLADLVAVVESLGF